MEKYKNMEEDASVQNFDKECAYLKDLEQQLPPNMQYDPENPFMNKNSEFDTKNFGDFLLSTTTPKYTIPQYHSNTAIDLDIQNLMNNKRKKMIHDDIDADPTVNVAIKSKDKKRSRGGATSKRKAECKKSATVTEVNAPAIVDTVVEKTGNKFKNFITNFESKKLSLSLEAVTKMTPGKHDPYIDLMWNLFSEVYTTSFPDESPLLPFDVFTDLFYIKIDTLIGKNVFLVFMSEETFNSRTKSSLIILRRALFARNYAVINLPVDNHKFYKYFINTVVAPYIYFGNVSRAQYIKMCVICDEEKDVEKLSFDCHILPFEKFVDCVKSIL